jgi:hypothetical protein
VRSEGVYDILRRNGVNVDCPLEMSDGIIPIRALQRRYHVGERVRIGSGVKHLICISRVHTTDSFVSDSSRR